MAGYKFSQEETQNIIKLYTDGKSINKIPKDADLKLNRKYKKYLELIARFVCNFFV